MAGAGNRKVHAAVQQSVYRVAHIQVVFGEQETAVMLSSATGGNDGGVACGVGVVHLRRGLHAVRNGECKAEKVTELPEQRAHRHVLGVAYHLDGLLHHGFGGEHRPQPVRTGQRVDGFIVQIPQRLRIITSNLVKRVHELLGHFIGAVAVKFCSGIEKLLQCHAGFSHGEVDHVHPQHVARHVIEVFGGGFGVPRDVDDAERQLRIVRDDVVNHRRHTPLKERVG